MQTQNISNKSIFKLGSREITRAQLLKLTLVGFVIGIFLGVWLASRS